MSAEEGGGGTSDATKEIVTFEVGNKLSFPENVIFIGEFNGEERRRNIENRRRNGKGKKRGNGRKGMRSHGCRKNKNIW